MPVYYFHASNGAPVHDRHGTNLNDDEDARVEALRYAGDLLKWSPDLLTEHSQLRVMVTDDRGALLFTVVTLVVEVPQVQRISRVTHAND